MLKQSETQPSSTSLEVNFKKSSSITSQSETPKDDPKFRNPIASACNTPPFSFTSETFEPHLPCRPPWLVTCCFACSPRKICKTNSHKHDVLVGRQGRFPAGRLASKRIGLARVTVGMEFSNKLGKKCPVTMFRFSYSTDRLQQRTAHDGEPAKLYSNIAQDPI